LVVKIFSAVKSRDCECAVSAGSNAHNTHEKIAAGFIGSLLFT
jgi:hypothetical protein